MAGRFSTMHSSFATVSSILQMRKRKSYPTCGDLRQCVACCVCVCSEAEDAGQKKQGQASLQGVQHRGEDGDVYVARSYLHR
jgi:hypothetical protein